ncbi:MAG: hypothetical protein FNT15_08590 [Sulfurovum sp.]|nr:MAG: hypothetical protein FNT15_08590 [Sulfurovum sp.]
MTGNQFWNAGDRGMCPSCGGRNIKSVKGERGGWNLLWCRDCDGIPVYCANTQRTFINHSNNSVRRCPLCGECDEYNLSADNHACASCR